MNPQYQKQYDQMIAEISNLSKKTGDELQRVETGYHIARRYWDNMKKIFRDMVFANIDREVEFFRDIKPLFMGRIEYFILLYEALLAAKAQDIVQSKFWQAEGKRYERFYRKNEDFLRYYESGSRDQDHLYFTRSNKYPGILANARLYDLDSGLYSHYGQILSSWLAWKMYKTEIERKLG